MISQDRFNAASIKLGCHVAAIKAVAEVESSGSGFLKTGEPVILFEPHVFWKELKKRGIDPAQYEKGNEDILYPVWGSKPYGKSSEQHGRLARAVVINREAAICSASWGKFQIMGYNWKICGYDSVQSFINAMYRSEDDHLDAFVNYIISSNLDDELRNKAWAQFALQYNGKGYLKNRYDTKLKAAYERFLASG